MSKAKELLQQMANAAPETPLESLQIGKAAPEPPEEPRKPRKPDPELKTMAQLDYLMCDLPNDESRGRVLLWLCGKHGPPGFRASIQDELDPPDTEGF